MKLLLGLLLVALAVCQICGHGPIDMEHRYAYRVRVATGILGDIKQISGLGATGIFTIQNQGKYTYAKLDIKEEGLFNDHVTTNFAEELPITYSSDSAKHATVFETLRKPFRVSYEKGLVKTFEHTPDDTAWSLNIKRAIISQFQLNFDGVNPVKSSKSNYLKHEGNENFFIAMEDGIAGKCPVSYKVSSYPYHKRPYERVLNVTKLRFYDDCIEKRPVDFHSTHLGYKCDGCENIEPFKSFSSSEYEIHGERHFPIIEKISNTGKFLFTPFGTESVTAWSGVNQTFVLIDTSEITEPITFPGEHNTSASLKYNHDRDGHYHEDSDKVDLHKSNHYSTEYYDYSSYEQKAVEHLQYLSQDFDVHDDDKKKDYPERLSQLVRNIGSMSFEDIKKLYDTHLAFDYQTATPDKQRQKMVFWDVLPIVGTNPTISFIIHATKENYLPAHIASEYFELMAHYAKDHSETLIDHFLEYTESINKDDNRHLFKTFWLVFGTLVNRGCEHEETLIHGEHHIRHEMCTKYVDLVFAHFEKATETWEKTLFMKVLANIELPELYNRLKPIVNGDRIFPIEVRRPALLAFHKVSYKITKAESLAVVVPVFNNNSEPIAIRLLAFEIIMSGDLSYEVLQVIGDHLRDEPSRQVASFVYSTFKALANSTNPCHTKIGARARKVLQNIPEYFYGYQYAHKILLGYYNDKYHFGGETTLAYIGANDSFVPEYVFLEESYNILGKHFDYFSVDFRGSGFSRMYDRMFGRSDSKDESKSLMNILRRKARDVNTNDKEVEEYRNTLNLVNREPNPIHGSLSFKMFNQEYSYLDFAEEGMKQHLHDGDLHMPKELPKMLQDGIKVNKLKSVMLGDVHYEIPNDVGLPVVFSWQYPGYASVKGEIKLDVQPGFSPQDREFKRPTNVKLSIDAQPAFHVKGIAHVAVNSPVLSYGLGVHHDISMKYSVKVNADYDIKEKKFHINYKPTQSKYELFNIKTYPFTYIDLRNNFISPAEEPLVKPIHTSQTKTLKGSFGQKYFGVGLSYEESNEYQWNDFASIVKFFGSFFTKMSRTFDSYSFDYHILPRYINAWKHFQDYLFLSPQIIPVDMKIHYEPSKEDPTTEFDLTVDFDKYFKTSTESPLPPVTAEVIKDADPTFRQYSAIHADLTAKGKTEKKYKLSFSNSRDYYNMVRKAVLEYERTPIPSYDTEPFKLCAYVGSKIPTYDKWYSFDEQLEKKAEMTLNINFGKDCKSGSKIDAKTVVERTDEQKMRDVKKNYAPYNACVQDMKNGYMVTSYSCWDALIEYYTLKNYTSDIHYENLPESFKSFALEMTYWIKHNWFLNIDHFENNVANPANHIKIITNYSMYEPATLDMEVHRPDSNIFYKNIYYPKHTPHFQHFHLRMDRRDQLIGHIFNYGQTPVCAHEKDAFVTFDGVSYKFQAPVNNYYMLAKDCSKNEKFLVLAKELDHATFKKSVKVFILGTKIEILPLDASSPLVVRVNDVVKPVKDQSVLLTPDPKHIGQVLVKIVHTGTQYVIESHSAGVKVVYTGNSVITIISNQYRGETCGLCGNLDGEATNEFVGPKGCVYNNEQAFGYSYLISSQKYPGDNTCIYPYAPKFVGKCNVLRNKIIHDVSAPGLATKAKNVCFSTRPIPDCAPGCKVENGVYDKTNEGFHCLNAGHSSTGDMITRVNNLQTLPELEKKSQDYFSVVQYPRQCVKA